MIDKKWVVRGKQIVLKLGSLPALPYMAHRVKLHKMFDIEVKGNITMVP